MSPLTALHNSCLSMALPSSDLLIEREAASVAPEGLPAQPEVGQQPAKRSGCLVALAVSCALLTLGALSLQFGFSNRQKAPQLHSCEANLKAVPCPGEGRAEV